MRQKRVFLCLSLLSIMFILVLRRSVNHKHQPIAVRLVRAPPTLMKDTLVLNDGAHNYYLNLTSFRKEFPYLQSYRCTPIQSPQARGQGEANETLVFLALKSHPNNQGRRAALRQTWATERVINGYRLRPVFLLGRTPVAGHMEMVKHESTKYGDILQWDMMEGHHNLSLKERCFLQWLHLNSSQVHFIFKGDDDVFVNPEMVVGYITEQGTPGTVLGYYQHRPLVMRHTKYSISSTLYPQERYPGFVSGGGFLFPGAAVTSLYEASQLLPVFPLDDVYFGFLALAANLTFRHESRIYVYGLDYDPCRYRQALMVHGVSFHNFSETWQEVQRADCRAPGTKNTHPVP